MVAYGRSLGMEMCISMKLAGAEFKLMVKKRLENYGQSFLTLV